ncbi:uncharacterized protein LOC121834224, partial [Ixodes scapularis]|uniref:uncharacterized protein LOC121834224 n=1 Tax=Ixodes scapularis TaxID=6945 RepID=UPI001C395B35
MPTTQMWQEVAKGFEQKWNFPHCFGEVDGKHLQIQALPHSGSMYYSYKSTYSIVLMPFVENDLRFVSVDVGAYGRQSDVGTLHASRFGKCLEEGPSQPALSIASPKHVDCGATCIQRERGVYTPPGLSAAIPGKNQDEEKIIFNYRLSRARFRIFLRTINVQPESADYVVITTCVLHNFLREDSIYMSQSCVDSENAYGTVKEGQWREILKDEGSAMFVLKPPVGHN